MAAKRKKSSKAKKPTAKSSKARAAAKSTKLTGEKAVTKKAATKSKPETVAKPQDIEPQPVAESQVQPQTTTESSGGVPEQRLTKTYLTPEELKHFENILLQKRAEVLRDLEIMRNAYSEDSDREEHNSSYSMHMADHGTETMDREQHFMFIARDERYLSYIDKALERIKNGTYGICAVSGLPIPKERLEAVPHTAVRIEYKNRGK
jgi:RNA polymerase-binding transcription factor DksA